MNMLKIVCIALLSLLFACKQNTEDASKQIPLPGIWYEKGSSVINFDDSLIFFGEKVDTGYVFRVTGSYNESGDTVFVKAIESTHSYFKTGDSFVYIRQNDWIWFQKYVNRHGVVKEEYSEFEVGLAHKRFYPAKRIAED
ncbi:MAG: hypothetical protein GF401_05280 [Chitinivibrionales bacterium]|nr:hypothetical protein [Chitinivibrionales bacterium]